LPVVLPEALNVPLRAALALVAESRHSAPAITAVHVIAPRLVLLVAGFRNRMFVPSLLGMMLFGPIRLHARGQSLWMDLPVAILRRCTFALAELVHAWGPRSPTFTLAQVFHPASLKLVTACNCSAITNIRRRANTEAYVLRFPPSGANSK
jgi:hypothetical protein